MNHGVNWLAASLSDFSTTTIFVTQQQISLGIARIGSVTFADLRGRGTRCRELLLTASRHRRVKQ